MTVAGEHSTASILYSVSRTHEVHIIFYLFPLPFPSWEGLGVGSSYLLRSRSVAYGLSPCSVRVAWPTASVPKNQKFVPHKS
ncbi:hypothetical protein [Moorena producens]|uniref:hypothetical protein n=1 Tax=Moorena producens TaxID=1155739 RepID=UPI0011EA6D5D|nr:hypothetical protein [Moorena producens]